jgi:hypothetical protein
MSHAEMSKQVQTVEKEITNRLPMGSKVNIQRLINDLERVSTIII